MTMYSANEMNVIQKGGSSMLISGLAGRHQRLLHLMVIALIALGTLAPVASARILHADLGRWTRRDPLGYVDGWGLYGYGKSQPLNGSDPDGQVFTTCIVIIVAGLLLNSCTTGGGGCPGGNCSFTRRSCGASIRIFSSSPSGCTIPLGTLVPTILAKVCPKAPPPGAAGTGLTRAWDTPGISCATGCECRATVVGKPIVVSGGKTMWITAGGCSLGIAVFWTYTENKLEGKCVLPPGGGPPPPTPTPNPNPTVPVGDGGPEPA